MSKLLNTIFMVVAIILDYLQKGLMMFFGFRLPVKGNIEADGRKVYYMPSHPKYRDIEVSVLKGEKYFITEAGALKAGWVSAK